MFDYTKEGGIVVTTYTMLSYQRTEGSAMTENADKRKKICEDVPWGLVIFDEV